MDHHSTTEAKVPVIEVKDLVKSYQKGIPVLKNLSLCVQKQEIYGFLGANGAGKSTTIEILEGYLPYDSGKVSILGLDPKKEERALRHKVGLMLQDTSLPPYLTVQEALDFFCHLYPHSFSVKELLSLFQLESQVKTQIRRLSGGQRRKLDMAIAISGKPELVFLDEPTTGFDPHSRLEAWKVIRYIRELGSTVFLTTQHLEEADALCDRVSIIVSGAIAVEGSPHQLKEQVSGLMVIEFQATLGITKEQLLQLPQVVSVEESQGRFVVKTSQSEKTMRALYQLTETLHLSVPDLTISRPTLEDVFFAISQKLPTQTTIPV